MAAGHLLVNDSVDPLRKPVLFGVNLFRRHLTFPSDVSTFFCWRPRIKYICLVINSVITNISKVLSSLTADLRALAVFFSITSHDWLQNLCAGHEASVAMSS
jgi:hypothetical protein